MSSQTFAWLHLTDLHFGLKDQGFLWPNLRQPFFDDLDNLRALTGAWDAVLFTGDLTQQGKSDEFRRMQAEFLDKLWQKLHGLDSGEAKLLAVPGNHDLFRPDPKADNPAIDTLLEIERFPKIADKFWNNPTGAYRNVITEAFAAYTEWWQAAPHRPSNIRDGLLPGDFAYSLECKGLNIGLVGLNTAFLQLQGGDYQGKLVWDARQLHSVCQDVSDWHNRHDFCLLLTHHGTDWLTTEAQQHGDSEIAPPGRFIAHLHGHNHENRFSCTRRGGSQKATRLLQACSIFGMDTFGEPPATQRNHGYVVGQIKVADGQASLRYWPRTATKGTGGWRFIPDHDNAELEQDEATAPDMLRYRKTTSNHRIQSNKPEPNPIQPTPELQTYQSTLKAQHHQILLPGFKTRLTVPIDLEELYVPLRAIVDLRGSGCSQFADAEDAEKQLRAHGSAEIALMEAFPQAHSRKRKHVVILGDPGSGKTTQLKRLLLQTLQDATALGLAADTLPVFLPLRDLDDIKQGIAAFIEQSLDSPHLNMGAGFGKRLLQRGRLLLLFDGLDEVSDAKHRAQVARWIEQAVQTWPDCNAVVTCRFAGYDEASQLNAQFLELHLRPLTPEQSDSFIRNWYTVVETGLTPGPSAVITAHDKAHALIERLREPDFRSARMATMIRNPLLLANLCLVHRDRGGILPKGRHELYDECIDVLLERWREAKPRKDGQALAVASRRHWDGKPYNRSRCGCIGKKAAPAPAPTN